MKDSQKQLTKELAAPLIEAKHIENLNDEQLIQLFHQEEGLHLNSPEPRGQTDPRSGGLVLFNPARAARPNTYQQEKSLKACPICEGSTTGIIDFTELSEGFTFINKNLFPAVYPRKISTEKTHVSQTAGKGFPIWGLHLLQWTSSLHDQDWHNMAINDLKIVMSRLGTVERHLLTILSDDNKKSGHVSIIKNGGVGSGGSLAHGHQQIIYSNALPQRIAANLQFKRKEGAVFSQFLLEENPTTLTIKDFGEAVLIVPYFMRRPYNMILVNRDTSKQYIHHLSNSELTAAAKGWKAGIKSMSRILSGLGIPISYNVITHNGPGAGLYFEFLPRSQTEGGFEMLGASVCQSSPEIAADQIRNVLESNLED